MSPYQLHAAYPWFRRLCRLVDRIGKRFGFVSLIPYYCDSKISSIELGVVGDRDIPPAPSEIRLFACVRNESLRLPYFLKHYSKLGVDRFFFVDNGSTDASRDIILRHPGTHLFQTKQSYAEAGCGHRWLEQLIRLHGTNRWCLIADADELLTFPREKELGLRGLCAYLEERSFEALPTLLVERYGRGSIRDTVYRGGADLPEAAPYFDRTGYERLQASLFDRRQDRMSGGMRKRVFDILCHLNKTPLFRYRDGMKISAGAHSIWNARLADVRGAVLHFKYLSDFAGRVKEESQRQEHWNMAEEYKAYHRKIVDSSMLTAYDPAVSDLCNEEALLSSGILKISPAFRRFSLSLRARAA